MPLAIVMVTLLRMMWRRRWLTVGLVLVLGGGAAAVIFTTPTTYTARSTILAKFGREHTLRSYGTGGGLIPVNYGSEQIVASAIEIMQADELLGIVVDEVGPERLYPQLAGSDADVDRRQEAIKLLDDNLDVIQIGRSNVIAAELTYWNGEMAADALNRFVDAFRVKYAALYAENMVPVLEIEVRNASERAALAVETVRAFENERLIFPDDSQVRSLFDQRILLTTQLSRLKECCGDSSTAAALEVDLAITNRRIVELNSEQSELRDLTRERDRAEDQLEQARLRLQDALNMRTVDDGGGSSIQVISAAVAPYSAAGPGPTTKLAMALVLVSVFSVAFALTVEFLKRRYSVAAELSTDLPVKVLAEIPYAKTKR